MGKYKIQIFLMVISTIVITTSCNSNRGNIALNTYVDSLNYSIGVKEMTFTTEALLKATDTITASDKEEILSGYLQMVNATEKEELTVRAMYNGTKMGDNFNIILANGYLYGDSAIDIRKELIKQGIYDALHRIDWVKDSRTSLQWIKDKVLTPLTEEEIDTANYIAGFLNGHQMRNMIIKNDTMTDYIESFCEYFFKAWDGSKKANLAGLDAGKEFLKRYSKSNYCFNDSTLPINKELIKEGYCAYFKGKELLISVEDAERMLTTYIKQRTENLNAQSKNDKTAIDKFFAENAEKENVFTTEDPGIQYEIQTKGNGIIATENDTIIAHIVISVKDINEVSDSRKKGEPIKLPIAQMVPSWKNIFTTMPSGSKLTIYNRHDEKQNMQDPFPPQSIITYEIEIIDIARNK